MPIFLSTVAVKADPSSLQRLRKDVEDAISGKSELKLKAQIDLTKAQRALEDFNAELKKISKIDDPSGWEKVNVKIADAEKQVKKYTKSVEEASGETGKIGAQTSTWQKLGSAIGGVLAIGTVVNWGKKIFDAASQVQQLQISFGTMLGSAEKGKKLFAELQEFARVTPFNATDIQRSSRLLLAFGVQAKDILPTMKSLGEAVSAAGGNGETLNNAARAIGQIQTKGKLMAQEVNQLAENGIPVWGLLATAMGKSEAEIMKMTEDGKMLAKDVLPTLFKEMDKVYGGNMAKQAETLNGRLSNIQDTFAQTLATIGNTVNPIFNAILTSLNWLVQKLGYMATEFPRLTGLVISFVAGVGLIGGAIAILGPIFGAFAGFMGLFTASTGAATVAVVGLEVAAAPLIGTIGLIVGALALLGIGAVVAMDMMAGHDKIIVGYKDSMSSLEEQQRANEQAYNDGTISTEEYRKKQEELKTQIEENKRALEEYEKGQKIIDDGNLNYIQRIEEINKLKLDPSAYDALIEANRQAQEAIMRTLQLQIELLDKQHEIDKKASESRKGAESGGGTTMNVGMYGENYLNKKIELTKQLTKETEIEAKGEEKVIKREDEKKKKIEGTTGATGGAKKENEALKKSVDKLKDSYKILENDIKKVHDTREKQIKAEKKWNESLREEQKKTEESLVSVRKEYQKTIDKLNEDANKQNIDTVGGYYQSLLDDKKKLEKEAIDEAVRLSNEGAAAGGVSRFNEYTGPTIDPNTDALGYIKYIETYGAATQLVGRQVLKDIEAINTQIAEIQTLKKADGTLALDQNTKAGVEQRNSLTDQEKVRFDFLEKYGKIGNDLGTGISKATESLKESRNQIEGLQRVIAYFETTNDRGALLKNKAESLILQNPDESGKTSDLVKKLLKEKQDVTILRDARIAAEVDVNREANRLATEYHTAELGMVKARKAEYDELITKIQSAIQSANALRASQATTGISTTKSTGKGFADGGYTGDGEKYDVAGVVHKGEYVIPQNILENIRKNMPSFVPSLEAMRTGNTANTSHIDQSRHISITGPIRVEREVDFERLLSRAAWRNR